MPTKSSAGVSSTVRITTTIATGVADTHGAPSKAAAPSSVARQHPDLTARAQRGRNSGARAGAGSIGPKVEVGVPLDLGGVRVTCSQAYLQRNVQTAALVSVSGLSSWLQGLGRV